MRPRPKANNQTWLEEAYAYLIDTRESASVQGTKAVVSSSGFGIRRRMLAATTLIHIDDRAHPGVDATHELVRARGQSVDPHRGALRHHLQVIRVRCALRCSHGVGAVQVQGRPHN